VISGNSKNQCPYKNSAPSISHYKAAGFDSLIRDLVEYHIKILD